jgi:hypothetical protein
MKKTLKAIDQMEEVAQIRYNMGDRRLADTLWRWAKKIRSAVEQDKKKPT